MKRTLFLLAAICLLLTFAVPCASAATTVPVTVDDALVGGNSYIEGGVTMVPLRELCNALGGWTVLWDGSAACATAKTGSCALRAVPGASTITINGNAVGISKPVALSGGRVCLPLRAVCRALNLSVSWDSALGGAAVSTGKASVYSADELYWLSRIISAESQGESLKGQIAVGNVVLNRVASTEFPNTIKSVIFDSKDGTQFEPVSNKTVYNAPTPRSVAAAKAALAGTRIVGKCLYFYAPALSQGTWIRTHRTYYTTIGCHRFYL